ncbi:hypothetical protein AXF42_Ash008217 [Apostasia shenzhenica]|uniref:RING-CH-type domain-containing protein n=1 Tax=Apostasia shenzhenica TaxID=1088818 RepID=A0A2I0A8Y5_9ASPA|nr:hypothetical protein AXF42_Ash008217 [Apostasia shenzhenica]
MVMKEEKSSQDVESGPCRTSTANESDGSVCFSDAEEEHWHSPYESNSVYEFRLPRDSGHEISGAQDSCRNSCISDCSGESDLECGTPEIKVNVEKPESDCRICHLSLDNHIQESGIPIVLGCSCKNDLAAAHKQCAETWFKIKGNKTCEICGATAKNVIGATESEFIESWNDSSGNTTTPRPRTETRSFWQGHRFLNFLLACMVFAFVISWLFHFNVPG